MDFQFPVFFLNYKLCSGIGLVESNCEVDLEVKVEVGIEIALPTLSVD